MGKKSNKYFSVNMNTTEPEKPDSTQNNNNNHASSFNSAGNNNLNTSKQRIKFNQQDLAKSHKSFDHTQNVRRIENPEELIIGNEEKIRPKDIKVVLIPAIILIILCVLNIIFLSPIVLESVVKYVLKGRLVTLELSALLSNDELLIIAGLTAIVAYSIFSIALLCFSIYNIFKLVYIKRDLYQIGFKILLYSFLAGFLIAAIDAYLKFNLTDIIVRVTTFNLHNITMYIK